MWRVLTPLLLVAVAVYVYVEGHDQDGVFYLFPMVEQLPGVTDDPVARSDASAAILVVVAVLVGALNVASRRAARDD